MLYPFSKEIEVETKPKPMTPQEFEKLMRSTLLINKDDPEASHREADRLMAFTLETLGFGKGVKLWEQSKRWYA